MSIGLPIPGIQLFQNLMLKIQGKGRGVRSKLKVTTWVNIQSTYISFIPCQSDISFLSYHFSKSWPWKSRVKVMGEVTFQSPNVGLTSYQLTSLLFMSTWSISLPIPQIQHFQNLSLKTKGQGQMAMMLHNYRSEQFHRTSNGITPSSGFRDMGSTKSGPSAAWFDKFLDHGQAHMGQMGQ